MIGVKDLFYAFQYESGVTLYVDYVDISHVRKL